MESRSFCFDPNVMPPVIGHRGAALHAPENTLSGLRDSARLGARWVEVDVKLTSDDVPILMHDDTLDRTTDGSGPVVDQSFEAIRRLDAGGWFGAAFEGERVPSLEEVLTLCRELELGINLEVKPNPGQAIETVAGVADQVKAHVEARFPVLISSFCRESVLAARDRLPVVPRALLVRECHGDTVEFLKESGACGLNPHFRLLQDRSDVTGFTEAGYTVIPYTVNDGDRIRELLAWGVTSVVTDDPLLARA